MKRLLTVAALALAGAGCHDRVVLAPDPSIPEEKSAFWHDLDHEIKTWERLQDQGQGTAAIRQGRRIGSIVLEERPTVLDALTNDAHGWRPIAAAAVGFSNDETFNASLERCVAARDPRVVANALTSLGHLRYRYYDPRWIASMFRREDPSIRVGAAFLVGRTLSGAADEEVLYALVLATTDPVVRVRVAAAAALGDLREPAGVRALADRLHTDPDRRVRAAAARSLGRVGGDDAIAALLATLDREADVEVRESIYAALAEATGLSFGRDDRRWWDWWNRRLGSKAHAPKRGGELGTHEGKPAGLLGGLETAGEMEAVLLVEAARLRGTAQEAPGLAAALARPELVVRLGAVQATWELAGPAGLEVYEAALADPSEKVRRVAAERALEAGSPRGIPVLLDALDSEDELVRVHANSRLRAWTGQEFGFLPEGDEKTRHEAAARWRRWWETEGATFRPKKP